MKKEKCRLCLTKKNLCESHILPEFVYKSIYDEKHKYHEFDRRLDIRNKKRWKGIYEHLFCLECEVKLSGFETYIKEKLFDNPCLGFPIKTQFVTITDINYLKIKWFQLSILWRASLSKHPLFKNVQLGPYEEQVRQIIKNESYVPPEHYPCFVAALVNEDEHIKGFIMEVDRFRAGQVFAYKFLFGGFAWLFWVSDKCNTGVNGSTYLNAEEMKIGQVELMRIANVADLFFQIDKHGKFDVFEGKKN